MNMYLLTQTENKGYNTYDSCVVIANNEEEAKLIHPNGYAKYNFNVKGYIGEYEDTHIYSSHFKPFIYKDWSTTPSNVKVFYLGEFKGNLDEYPNRVICASFNAG